MNGFRFSWKLAAVRNQRNCRALTIPAFACKSYCGNGDTLQDSFTIGTPQESRIKHVQCTMYINNFLPVQCCYLPQVFAKTIIHLNGVLKRINREAGSEIVTFIAQLYDNMNSEPQIICPQSWQITFQSQETFFMCQLRYC